jgi:parvulin-like peptidyl-prolyl cis-trans isomerase-like protein
VIHLNFGRRALCYDDFPLPQFFSRIMPGCATKTSSQGKVVLQMHRTLPIVVLALLGLGQAQRGTLPSSSNPRQPRAVPQANVAPAVSTPNPQAKTPPQELGGDVPVITIHGLCPAGSDKTVDIKSCTTTLTKDQFEDVVSAVSLGGQVYTPNAIRDLADTYVQYLVLADAAERNGVDKDPRIQELLRVVRLRTLADAYRRSLEEKFRSPSPDEMEKYYRENISKFEAVKAERLFIPKYNPKSPKEGAAEFEKKAMAMAEEVRDRAAKGESLDRLQSEAFLKLGMVAPSLLPDTGMRRRGSFAPDVEAEIFTLKPGEVSKITTETGGFVVYRLIRRDIYTLEQVKGEVVTAIYRQKMEGAVKGVLQSVKTELNDQYFAKPTSPRPLPTSGTPAPGANPGSKRMQSSHSVKLPPSAKPSAAKPTPKQ